MNDSIKKQVRDGVYVFNQQIFIQTEVRWSAAEKEEKKAKDLAKLANNATSAAQIHGMMIEIIKSVTTDLDREISACFPDGLLHTLQTKDEIDAIFGNPPVLESIKQLYTDLWYMTDAAHKELRAEMREDFDKLNSEHIRMPELLAFCDASQKVYVELNKLEVLKRRLKMDTLIDWDRPSYAFLDHHPLAKSLSNYNTLVGSALLQPEDNCVPTAMRATAAAVQHLHEEEEFRKALRSQEYGHEGQEVARKTFQKSRECQLQFLRVVVRSEQASGRRPIKDLKNLAEHINDPKSAAVLKAAAKEAGTSLGKLPKMETLAGYLVSNRASDKKAWQPIRDNLTAWIEQLKTVRQLR